MLRGDRVAFVGPNGVGKTTLLKMLTGEMAPDAGTVTPRHQPGNRGVRSDPRALDPEASLWENLTGDPRCRSRGAPIRCMVRGQPRHVVAYLKDFLFDEAQARAPVALACRAAKRRGFCWRGLMAKPSNLLILDEPTNDLDVETLDLSAGHAGRL